MALPISDTRHLTRSLLSGATLASPPRLPSSVHCGGSRLACSTRSVSIRCRANRSGSAYSPLSSGSSFSDRPPTTEMAPLFPGCDYEHWLIVMDKPGGEGATKQEMVDCYVQTLAKVVGSEEEAKKRIYNVSCERFAWCSVCASRFLC
ncbi:multiple organellar RNA editing factor 2, chloroplastic-like isoform X1 [Raphanus sativus]|uniref:Multiple organellar RNA editing factor 2, chloroplastic-like isoform X1 n=1 Tax=Raphanus sativus TaxID=3726 RepID=A0A6J0MQ88_RAPSA|nr:multiple organellar RNA editing factor 2, chloroplastic-like isoform X1 [Raphanus sativus]